MTTYIDKDRLCERLEKRYHEVKKYCGGPEVKQYMMGFREALNVIKKAPAVSYVHEDVEGKWVRMNNKEVKCSCCSLIRNITTQEGWKFCPSCGALMLEEE